ncbi:MAG: hypothetical protein DRO13_02855 [Thermoprotei archaeon]|nr:MAG: hypothetical protein DRO13_02855 [Thermoprotei archaeon]
MYGDITPYGTKDFAKRILGLTKLDWNTTELKARKTTTIKYARKNNGFNTILSLHHYRCKRSNVDSFKQQNILLK